MVINAPGTTADLPQSGGGVGVGWDLSCHALGVGAGGGGKRRSVTRAFN